MSKRNRNKRFVPKGNFGNFNSIKINIDVRNHAIDSFLLRSKRDLSRLDAIKKISNMVRQSRLVGMKNNEEHRSHNGFVFVCKREKAGLREKLVVVTMKLSHVRKKDLFSHDFDRKNIDFVAMKHEQKAHNCA